jgi:acyl carrier protein
MRGFHACKPGAREGIRKRVTQEGDSTVEFSLTQSLNGSCPRDRIRRIVKEHAGLQLALDQLNDSTDLYRAGMTSHASVLLMIALENEFGIEFPDHMLSRNVFENIDTIAGAIESVVRR